MQITTAFHRFRGAADLRCPVRGVGGWARPWSSTVGVPHGRSLLCSALQSPAPTRPESGAGWTFTGVSAAVGHRADLLWARVDSLVLTRFGRRGRVQSKATAAYVRRLVTAPLTMEAAQGLRRFAWP